MKELNSSIAQPISGSRSRGNSVNSELTELRRANMSELLDLNWDVFVTPGIPTVTSDLPPGTKQQMWSPISSTLIYGKRDAVLVDAPITVEQADVLVDWAV